MEITANYCRVVPQTREEVLAMYEDTPHEKLGEMLYECNRTLERTWTDLRESKSLVSTLVKSLFHVASGVRENNPETVRRYLHVIAEELAEHGHDRESSVITQYLDEPDVHRVVL